MVSEFTNKVKKSLYKEQIAKHAQIFVKELLIYTQCGVQLEQSSDSDTLSHSSETKKHKTQQEWYGFAKLIEQAKIYEQEYTSIVSKYEIKLDKNNSQENVENMVSEIGSLAQIRNDAEKFATKVLENSLNKLKEATSGKVR